MSQNAALLHYILGDRCKLEIYAERYSNFIGFRCENTME